MLYKIIMHWPRGIWACIIPIVLVWLVFYLVLQQFMQLHNIFWSPSLSPSLSLVGFVNVILRVLFDDHKNKKQTKNFQKNMHLDRESYCNDFIAEIKFNIKIWLQFFSLRFVAVDSFCVFSADTFSRIETVYHRLSY